MKVVINRCWGGFSISREAAEHMAANGSELAKKELEKYPDDKWYGYGFVDGSEGYVRHDPHLVSAVEALGEKSWGNHAKLAVVEVPDGLDYYIDEYDGMELVSEKHRTWG